jgi:hypothetical protein
MSSDASKQSPNGGPAAPPEGSSGINLSSTAFNKPTPGPKQRTVAEVLGEIVWLFSQSPRH